MNSLKLMDRVIGSPILRHPEIAFRSSSFPSVRCLHIPTCARLMAKKDKAGGGVRVGGGSPQTLALPQDSETLAKVCVGANVMKDEPFPELAEDSQYPEWLWSIRTTGPPSLEELHPSTVQYWEKLIELSYKQAELDRPKPKHRLLKDF